MRNKKPQHHNRTPIVMLVVLAILAGCIAFYILSRLNQPDDLSLLDHNANYNPPTQDEITTGEQIKNQNATKNQDPAPTDYIITIVDANQYGSNVEVRAFISGLVKNGGDCTYTFQLHQSAFTQTSPASADAAHTNCSPLIVPTSEFSTSGTWSLSVSYSYEGIIVTSTNQTFEVTK